MSKMKGARATWPDGNVKLLLEYLDKHKPEFQDLTTRSEAYERAAEWINSTSLVEFSYTRDQVSSKFSNLVDAARREGAKISLNTLFDNGSACLLRSTKVRGGKGPDLDHVADPNATASDQPESQEVAIGKPRTLTVVHRPNGQKSCNIGNDASTSLQKFGFIEDTAVCDVVESDFPALEQGGPSDGKIESQMEDCFRTLRTTVRRYQKRASVDPVFKGWGNVQRHNTELFALIEKALAVDSKTTPLQKLVQLNTMIVESGDLVTSIIGFFLYRNVFEEAVFPHLFGEKGGLLMKLMRKAIRTKYGIIGDLNILQAVRKSMLGDEEFRKWTLIPDARRKAEELNNILYPLLSVSHESTGDFVPDNAGGPGILAEFQGRLLPLFENGLVLSCQLKLNVVDDYTFFWPEPETAFDPCTMRTEADEHARPTASHVSVALFPGLRVSCNSECKEHTIQNGRSLHGVCRKEGGDVIVKATVVLSRDS